MNPTKSNVHTIPLAFRQGQTSMRSRSVSCRDEPEELLEEVVEPEEADEPERLRHAHDKPSLSRA